KGEAKAPCLAATAPPGAEAITLHATGGDDTIRREDGKGQLYSHATSVAAGTTAVLTKAIAVDEYWHLLLNRFHRDVAQKPGCDIDAVKPVLHRPRSGPANQGLDNAHL